MLCLRRSARLELPAAVASVPANFRRANSAERERTWETSFATTPIHPARTAPGQGRVPVFQSAQVNRAHTRFRRTGAPQGVQRPHEHHSKCKSRRPCRTVQGCATKHPGRDGTGTAPCNAKMGWARARGSPARLSGAGSQAFPPALRPVLGRTDEHFDQIVVQAVVELSLECPFKLRVIEIPGMKLEVVGMHWNRWILELDDHFHRVAFGARREIKQRMFVELQLRKNTFEPRICVIDQDMILTGVGICALTEELTAEATATQGTF